jgi:hypothetical protein
MTNKRSLVHNYFTIVSENSVKCNICDVELAVKKKQY